MAEPRKATQLPEIVPLFPLSGVILLPRGQLPLNVFEPRYLALVDDVLKGERMIGIVQPRDESAESARPPLFEIGGLGRITAFAETEDRRYLITLSGLSRFRIARELSVATPYRQAQAQFAEFAADRTASPDTPSLDRPALLSALRRYFTTNRIDSDWTSIERAPAESLVNSLSMIAPVAPAEKQALLEAKTVADRAYILITLIELALASQPDGEQKPN
jgi:Lon protease-like protein